MTDRALFERSERPGSFSTRGKAEGKAKPSEEGVGIHSSTEVDA